MARIVHAGGDATGAEIERALVTAVHATATEVHERWLVLDLLVEGGRAVGGPGAGSRRAGSTRSARPAHGRRDRWRGAVLRGHDEPVASRPATASRWRCAAGVAVADVEFMQFHPTALHHPSMPRPLLSEALRGEGAILRDEHGRGVHGGRAPAGDLAPRDVVARAITRRLNDRGLDHLWLDATLDRALRRPVPDGVGGVPGRRPRPDA